MRLSGSAPGGERYHVSDPAQVRDLPPWSRPAFFFVSYSRHGYGHLARSHRIAAAFVERAPLDAVVVSSHPDFSIGPTVPRVHEISLPSSGLAPAQCAAAEPDPGATGSLAGGPVADLASLRSRLLLDLVQRFRPRGLLVDFFPFPPEKAGAECSEALDWLRERVPTALLCAGFRGTLSRTYAPAEQQRVRELLRRYVDVLFVYLDAREEATVYAAYPFLRSAGPRVRFVGYVGPPRYAGAPRAGRVLATFGSGIHASSSVRLTCEAFLAFGRRHAGHTLEVVTGSRFPEAEYREILRSYDGTGRIRVAPFVPGLSRALGEYELVIAMGGYNTLVELHQSSARSIILSGDRTIAQTNERMTNAVKFLRYGAVDRVLDTGTTSPATLASAIEEVLASRPPRRREIDVDGAITTAKILEQALDRRARGAGAHG